MARRKKDDNVATLILIIIGAMAWGIYVAVKALINLNERFIESVSNPAGVIGLFFGLLIAIALIIRIIIYRGFRKKATDLAKKEQAFDETVSSEVACKLYQEKQQLAVQWTEFTMPEIKPPVHCSVLWILRINSKSKHYFPAPR